MRRHRSNSSVFLEAAQKQAGARRRLLELGKVEATPPSDAPPSPRERLIEDAQTKPAQGGAGQD